jgi:hypothetical protein
MRDGPGATPNDPPPPTRPKRRARLWVTLGVAVLVLILVAGILGSLPSGGSSSAPASSPSTLVHVSALNWGFSGAANCWTSSTAAGTVVSGGATFTVSVRLNYTAGKGQPSSCTVQSESVLTSGFTFVSANLPLVVPTGSSQSLSVTVLAPDSNVTTALMLLGSVTNTTTSATPSVNVTGENWGFSGPSNCWSSATGGGTRVAGDQTFAATITLNYTAKSGQPSECIVQSESVATAGFTFVSANTPLTVKSGGSQTLSVIVRAPDKNVTTALTLDGNVTSPSSATKVIISAVNWEFSGASNCWGSISTAGLHVTGGQNFTVSVDLNYTAGLLDPSSCTVQSESVATSGFTFLSANTPLVVDTGGSSTLTVTCRAPETNETTVLTLDGVDTSP